MNIYINLKYSSLFLALIFYSTQVFSVVILNIEDHIDDPNVLDAIEKKHGQKLYGLSEYLIQIEQAIINLDIEGKSKILQEAKEMDVDSYVLASFSPREIQLSGIGGFKWLAYSKFYPVSDFAGIKVNTYKYETAGMRSIAIIYFRIDNDFTKLKSIEDFEKRLIWDKNKLKKFTAWYENIIKND